MEYISTFAAVLLAFNVVFIFALIMKNNSIVDPFWGIGFIVAALYSFSMYGGGLAYQVLVTGLVLVWGVRLSARLIKRNWRKPEDWRYAKWRNEWDPKWFYLRSYLQVFVLQALLCFVIALPIIFVNSTYAHENEWIVFAGITVWILGFLFEAVGDWQLDQFMQRKDKKKNELLTSGLWRYTRHPNYFGEATQWWGIWIIAMGVSFSAWWAIISPVLITFLLLKVSGVPMLEEKMQKNPNFKAYMDETNKFIPGPIKSKTS